MFTLFLISQVLCSEEKTIAERSTVILKAGSIVHVKSFDGFPTTDKEIPVKAVKKTLIEFKGQSCYLKGGLLGNAKTRLQVYTPKLILTVGTDNTIEYGGQQYKMTEPATFLCEFESSVRLTIKPKFEIEIPDVMVSFKREMTVIKDGSKTKIPAGAPIGLPKQTVTFTGSRTNLTVLEDFEVNSVLQTCAFVLKDGDKIPEDPEDPEAESVRLSVEEFPETDGTGRTLKDGETVSKVASDLQAFLEKTKVLLQPAPKSPDVTETPATAPVVPESKDVKTGDKAADKTIDKAAGKTGVIDSSKTDVQDSDKTGIKGSGKAPDKDLGKADSVSSTGLIIGGVVGGIVLLLTIIGVVIYMKSRKRPNQHIP